MLEPTALLITGGTVVDGLANPPRPATDVLVVGDRIEAVGPGAVDAAARIGEVHRIEATGRTVMPGLIDAHCHITFGEPASNDELFFHREQSTAAMLAAFNVQKLLLAGVTGFLDADCLWNLGPALRDAIEAGIVEGPRMTAGMNALLTAAGGTAGRLIPDVGVAGYAHVVRDRDEMVRTTRQQIKHGADWIKIAISGGIADTHGSISAAPMTDEELKTLIEVAHRIEPAHRQYLHYFRRALAAYGRADQLRAEDKSGKWALKVKHYKVQIQKNDPSYAPDTCDRKLVALLFPEIYAEP